MELYPEKKSCNLSNFVAWKFCFKILDLLHSLSTSFYGLIMLRGTLSFTSISSESPSLVSCKQPTCGRISRKNVNGAYLNFTLYLRLLKL